MSDSDHIFDYLAAAEESMKQMDLMVRQIPGHIKTALIEEYRKSPWMTEMPKVMVRLEKVLEESQRWNREVHESNRQLRQTVWLSGGICVLVFVAFVALSLLSN